MSVLHLQPARTAESVADLIGRTPLVRLRRFRPGGASLYLKLEQFNPGGSIKDRTALGMIVRAEQDGLLRPGRRIIESSSGNTAIGLAMLGRDRGYPVTAICDRYLPAAKRARLGALGASIVFLPDTPPGTDTVELRIAIASYLAKAVPDSVCLGQYSNPANPEIHYATTGPEIWSALDGDIDAVVMAVGTCGTISGVGRFLKERNPRIAIVGVEPDGSVIFGGCDKPYWIQGGGLSFAPSILDRSVIDEGRKVTDTQAIAAAHELALADGWLVGGTGGLVAHVLGELGRDLGPGRSIVGVIPDGGERYLDTLYDTQWLADRVPGVFRADRTHDAALEDVAGRIGCSVDTFGDPPAIGLDELCDLVGARLPVPAPGSE